MASLSVIVLTFNIYFLEHRAIPLRNQFPNKPSRAHVRQPVTLLSGSHSKHPDSACQACRLFRSWVEQDATLWRHLAIEPPLSHQLTEEALERAVQRGGGLVASISLSECSKISDECLKRVLASAPNLQRVRWRFRIGYGKLGGP